MEKKDETFPSEIAEPVKNFHLNLISLKKELEPIINDLYKIKDVVAKDQIKLATLELTMCQALNSLFYMYLQTTGIDARSHSIGHELYRVEKYMNRLKIIKEKEQRPKINKNAASAFVRNALFDVETESISRESNQLENREPEEIVISDDEDPTEEKPAKRLKTN